ncbi:hypothetical protein H6F43_07290 [Leptolyngbya sp. FACHB-36]|uniref:hypothetical protein n=1 Tax=Leptolyngbya sp. FACHB-36 TaxID=2692808 RepID=UPI0016802F01|nr:hypothetical protein [Leptolyngbya sp. FACHB-36]MBD2019990.1 hypothetical protein [Leptolyngbya sp. FACHB-36]
MNRRLSLSVQEKEQLFQLELVKACVPYDQAVKAARILVSECPDELLTAEDIQVVKQACLHWLEQRKRQTFISKVLEESFDLSGRQSF